MRAVRVECLIWLGNRSSLEMFTEMTEMGDHPQPLEYAVGFKARHEEYSSLFFLCSYLLHLGVYHLSSQHLGGLGGLNKPLI